MSAGITRNKALAMLRDFVQNERMIWHCLASEAVLKALARKLNQDEEKWGIAGLLHDLDVEITNADPKIHGLETAKILSNEGVAKEIIDAIRLHNEEATNEPRSEMLHHALAAGETITGLIIATALVYPDKNIASVKPKSVVKRMKEKAFAASVKRETILECERIGIPIEEFASIAVRSMQEISDQIGF
ncbi:MAG: HDIG domain-containing protein [Bacteroidetes bacterium]|nr:HDIG domain-containing protein [Bacteroidota bacterium]MBU1718316.1 HDIG domain-containing protein [Bacteroidota bacterium]